MAVVQKKISFSIKTASVPVYYQNFHCLADKCRDNCCSMEWVVTFNKKDFLRLRRLEVPDELKERLDKGVRRVRGKQVSDRMYAAFDLKGNGGCCPFLDENKLCEIQQACGPEALPNVCLTFPRRVSYTPAAKQYSLTPSCEGVLKLLWELPEGIRFLEAPLPKAEHQTLELEQGDGLARYYRPIRDAVIDILQNRALTLTERMIYLGITMQRLQKEDLSGFDPERWRHQTVSLMSTGGIKETLEKITGNRGLYLTQNLKALGEIVRKGKEPWMEDVLQALKAEPMVGLMPAEKDEGKEAEQKPHLLMGFSPESYDEALEEFERAFSEREYFFENLMVAAAWFLDFPAVSSREGLWKGYVSLCNLYSFYRFAAVLGCKGNETREQLFHIIAMSSKVLLHNRKRFAGFQEALFQNESSSLAHMTILLKG